MVLDLSKLPSVPLRILTVVLFILTSWATVGISWLGLSYILSNYFVVLLGIWAERDTPAPVPVQFFFFGVVFTFLNDIMSVGITYSGSDLLYSSRGLRSLFQFNAAMCIILIIAKPFACLFIYKEWQERVGGTGQQNSSDYERLGGQSNTSYNQGPKTYSDDHPPLYQPPHNQPFP